MFALKGAELHKGAKKRETPRRCNAREETACGGGTWDESSKVGEAWRGERPVGKKKKYVECISKERRTGKRRGGGERKVGRHRSNWERGKLKVAAAESIEGGSREAGDETHRSEWSLGGIRGPRWSRIS